MWAEPPGSAERSGSARRLRSRGLARAARRHRRCNSTTAMRRTTSILVTALFALSLSGCIFTTRDRGHRHGRVRSADRGCHPSQYWDGHQCRHKGRGHGARKHDGR